MLNSRTSVLAAANPVFGRYDDMKSPGENIDFQVGPRLSKRSMSSRADDNPFPIRPDLAAQGRAQRGTGPDHRQARHEHPHEPAERERGGGRD